MDAARVLLIRAYCCAVFSHLSYIRTNRHKGPVFKGDVYILTNIRTFSSAMDFAMYFADNHMRTLVGEASGNLPNAYGQCVKFRTPNSRLVFTVSVKRRHRIDMGKDSERIPQGKTDCSGMPDSGACFHIQSLSDAFVPISIVCSNIIIPRLPVSGLNESGSNPAQSAVFPDARSHMPKFQAHGTVSDKPPGSMMNQRGKIYKPRLQRA